MADIIKSLESRIKKLEENCRREKITKEDDEITVIVNCYLTKKHFIFYVKADDPVQTILDKYKSELVKNAHWPVNETEYKYILSLAGKNIDLSKTISDAGIVNETPVDITTQKINELLMKRISDLEKCCEEFKKFELSNADINNELSMKINELEKCCEEFKIFEIGEILNKDNYSSQSPNFKYSKFLKGNVAENRLLYILENDFENF